MEGAEETRTQLIARLYAERVTQAEQGCDFNFLANTPAK